MTPHTTHTDAPPVIERPLFFLDYDGTLAPIVERPEEAFPHPEAPELLEQLADEYPVWLVTGRHLRDLEAFLPDSSLHAIGLHGVQLGILGDSVERRMSEEDATTLSRLRERVPQFNGVWVEDKEYTFAVHYRQTDNREKAREHIQAWAETVPETFSVIWGKEVVELRPKGMHKGAAVLEVAARYASHTPMYIGDDVTDEDAFESLGEDGVTIKVGEGETRARYRLPSVEAVIAYLKKYL